ncbi:unnamed protein product [Meloidogyne enterolobii]|uniref:Uncharacterized protein n=1 Tax=Meloidogyne enterolobii TaxID=390850 RepID=A0ACB0XWR3_MELEN
MDENVEFFKIRFTNKTFFFQTFFADHHFYKNLILKIRYRFILSFQPSVYALKKAHRAIPIGNSPTSFSIFSLRF